MSNDSQKPSRRTAASVANNVTGRVVHDDRGNAVWEWAVRTGALALEPARRGSDAPLALADEPPPAAAPDSLLKVNPLGAVKGYSPYDSGVLGKREAVTRKKDLRRLGEWLRLKKQAERNKPE